MLVNLFRVRHVLEQLAGNPTLPSYTNYNPSQINFVWVFSTPTAYAFQSEIIIDTRSETPTPHYRHHGIPSSESPKEWLRLHHGHLTNTQLTLKTPTPYELGRIVKAASRIGSILFDTPQSPGYK